MADRIIIRSADYVSGNANSGVITTSFSIKSGTYKVLNIITTNNLPALFSMHLNITQCVTMTRSTKTPADNKSSIVLINDVDDTKKLSQTFLDLPQYLYFKDSTKSISYTWYDSAGAAIDLNSSWELILEQLPNMSNNIEDEE